MYFILKFINYQEFRKIPELDLQQSSSQIGQRQKKSGDSRHLSPIKSTKSRSQSLGKTSISPRNTIENDFPVAPAPVENKEVLINPDCYLGSILDYVCEVSGLARSTNFTMCTTSGEPICVNDFPLSTPGLEFFIPKETYHIILKDCDNFGNEVFSPLLHKSSEAYSYFMSKFNSMERPKKMSATSSASNVKVKTKEAIRSKSKTKSASSQREGKSHTPTLPPIKQKN